MIRVQEAIIVEGKYDKIRLSGLVDANIICTDGFTVFKNDELIHFLEKLADTTGVIILTDSDAAGFKIRTFLKNKLAGKNVKHAFIPSICGKEKRKEKPGKEGLLGVEGMRDEALLTALTLAGYEQGAEKTEKVTKSDFFMMGLSGGIGSREKRENLATVLGLPKRISANMMLDVINTLYTKEEFFALF